MAKVLLVEDDPKLAEGIKSWLEFDHHLVELVTSGADGLDRLRSYNYDVIILDWGLPELTGIDVCKEFRAQNGDTPILMLTGKNLITEKEVGFGAGVDDYLTKPFNLKELSLRVRALLARSGRRHQGDVLRARDIELNTVSFDVTKGGKQIRLLPKEFAVLEFLMRHPNEVFSAEALLARVWMADAEISSGSVSRCLSRLRKKLDDSSDESPIISTIHGVGYKLVT